jgi:hypothetical protein
MISGYLRDVMADSTPTIMTVNEIELVKDLCMKFSAQIPRLVAHIDTLELELVSTRGECQALRKEIYALETRFYQIQVMKNLDV